MYPNQNQPPDATNGMEYLEHISRQAKPPSRLSFINRKVLIIIVAFFVVLIALIIANVALSNRGTTNSEALSIKLGGLSSLIEYGTRNQIGDSAVKKTTAETSLVTSSIKVSLGRVMTLPTASKAAIAADGVDDIIAELDAAKSTGNQGQIYTAAVRSKINEVIEILDTLLYQAGSTSRPVIENAIIDFTEISRRLESV